jgi:HAD superfamily hydrolase (TIGR01549 family)
MFVSKYKAIVFDFDETLVKSYSVKWSQHQAAAKKFYGVNLTEETIRRYWGMPFEEMIGLFYEHKDTVGNMIKNYFSLNHLYRKYPYEDTTKVLNFLHDNHYFLGLVTSMTRESVVNDMKESGMPYDKFDLIQGSTDSEFHKPDPRVFDGLVLCLGKLNIKKEVALYIGDDIRDMQAARGAGLGFAAIPNGLTTRKEFKDQRAVCLNSLSDLIR